MKMINKYYDDMITKRIEMQNNILINYLCERVSVWRSLNV